MSELLYVMDRYFLHIGPRKRVRRLAATRRRGGRDRLLPPGLLWSACQSENADVVHYILCILSERADLGKDFERVARRNPLVNEL